MGAPYFYWILAKHWKDVVCVFCRHAGCGSIIA